jgi:hypothetical protein
MAGLSFSAEWRGIPDLHSETEECRPAGSHVSVLAVPSLTHIRRFASRA